MKTVPFGIDDFDKLLGGGVPEGYLILLAGGPGTGKTILSGKYIFEGARKYGENGVYVCFAETKDILHSTMKAFGWDFNDPKVADKITCLDLSTRLEIGAQQTLNRILETVIATKAKRLVIDSFTAMSMAMKEKIEVRYLIHLVYKFLRRASCTTLMIVDIPWGTSKIGSGSEEFIADGVILMENYYEQNTGKLRRNLKILKVRGVPHSLESVPYSINKKGIVFLLKKK